MKKIKKFLKNKRGNLVIIAIILIPTLLLIFSEVVIAKRREAVEESEILISLDNFADYVNENYGKILKINNKDVCSYVIDGATKNEIEDFFDSYVSTIDGYNDWWNPNITWSSEETGIEGVQSDILEISVETYIPKLKNSSQTIDYWGTYNIASNSASSSGWYYDHLATSKSLFTENHKPKDGKSNKYFSYKKIMVVSSCV
jgi:hypothetical protein